MFIHFASGFIQLIVADPLVFFTSDALLVRFTAIAIFIARIVSIFEPIFVCILLFDVGLHCLLTNLVRSPAYATSVPGEMALKGFK